MNVHDGRTAGKLAQPGARCCALLLAGAAAIGVDLLAGTGPVAFGATAFVVLGSLGMIGFGLWRYRPAHPLPWYLLSASAVAFAAGTALRGTGLQPLDDICTLTGYAGIGAAATLWLRPRQARANHDLLLDSGLIGLGALLASWTFLISPILSSTGPGAVALIAAAYPVLDALLLTLVAYSMATGTSEPSLRLLHIGLLAILIGDLGYSLDTVGARLVGDDVLQAPLLVAYLAVGVAAVHPTMTSLGAQRHIHPQHSRQRASMIAVALIVAALVPVVGSSPTFLDRAVVSALFALMLIGVLVRSERAIVRSARSERRAQYQADHDMLTGLLNRSALLRALGHSRERWPEHPLCLLFLDLDGFKMVNDSYGHAVGDELIANAAARIRRVVGNRDVAARYGGDEFVVLAPLDRERAGALAERLLAAFVRPFELSVGEIPITASIGVACDGPRSFDAGVYELLREADSAMYHAKERSLGYAYREDVRHLPTEPGRRVWLPKGIDSTVNTAV
ncbi:GGDEF domain-containing protein [Nocardia asteroides]|uniref:GGDEF domain-containing protein n=1 Tax=Nocardia asteroides TaxID=1824 RepID=UPI001E373BE7|nr:GGDEF domain-containing protein [Nocardia asteroides]UGT64019.1 diguanylate cyclase [Nocardia asteroides]